MAGVLDHVRSEHGAALGRLRTALCRVLVSAREQQQIRHQTVVAAHQTAYGALPDSPAVFWTDVTLLAFVPWQSR